MAIPIDYFDSESLRENLKGKTVRGGGVTAIAQACNTVIGLATIPLIAWLLDPEDLGLVAMVTVVTGFASMFADAGLSMATVQRPEVNHQQASNLFWITMAIGVLVAALLAGLAPCVSLFYGQPRLTPIMAALACNFVFGALVLQHKALMRRGMQFATLAGISLSSLLVGRCVGIAWAWRFYGQEHDYWALVVMPLSATLTQALLTWAFCRWRPGPPKRGAGTRDMVQFGAGVTGFSVTGYLARNADVFLIAWWWGDALVGVYSMALRIIAYPVRQLITPAGGVLIPMLSRLADKPDAYRRVYCRLLGVIALTVVPAVSLLAVVSDFLAGVLLVGDGWDGADTILCWLAVVTVTQVLMWVLGWCYVSQGRTKAIVHTGLLLHPAAIASIAVGLPWGPTAVAACYGIGNLAIRLPVTFWLAGADGHVSRRDLFRSLRPAFAPLLAMVLTALLARFALGDAPAWLGLAATSGAGLLGWSAAAYANGGLLKARREFEEIVSALRKR